MLLSSDLPQKLPLASKSAVKMPKGRLTTMATVETQRLKRMDVHSCALRLSQSNMMFPFMPHPEDRLFMQAIGQILLENGKTLLFKKRCSLWRF